MHILRIGFVFAVANFPLNRCTPTTTTSAISLTGVRRVGPGCPRRRASGLSRTRAPGSARVRCATTVRVTLVISVASVAVPRVPSRRGVAGGIPVTPGSSTTLLSRIADGTGGNSQHVESHPQVALTRADGRTRGLRGYRVSPATSWSVRARCRPTVRRGGVRFWPGPARARAPPSAALSAAGADRTVLGVLPPAREGPEWAVGHGWLIGPRSSGVVAAVSVRDRVDRRCGRVRPMFSCVVFNGRARRPPRRQSARSPLGGRCGNRETGSTWSRSRPPFSAVFDVHRRAAPGGTTRSGRTTVRRSRTPCGPPIER